MSTPYILRNICTKPKYFEKIDNIIGYDCAQWNMPSMLLGSPYTVTD
jgi:hypothetical protein